jgi:hypothetical protein
LKRYIVETKFRCNDVTIQRFNESVFFRVHLWLKAKTPPPVWQWGSQISGKQLEPDRRAAQQQRFRQQQVQIAIHRGNLANPDCPVK